MRKVLLSTLACALAGAGFAGVASAANVTYVVYPSAAPTGYSSDAGPAGAFQFDGDVNQPGTSATAPAGFGTSSFFGSVTDGAVPVSGAYTTFRVSFENLTSVFGHAVNVGDLSSISYLSNTTGTNDWKISIYTTAVTGAGAFNKTSNPTGNGGSFYHSRLQMIPGADSNGSWDQVTSTSTLWTDTNLNGGVQTGSTAYSAILAGPVTINGTTRDFSTESIRWIDFSLGAKTGGGTESGTIDGIVFNLADGESVTLNLEAGAPVPLPASAAMGATLLGALGLWRRGRAATV